MTIIIFWATFFSFLTLLINFSASFHVCDWDSISDCLYQSIFLSSDREVLKIICNLNCSIDLLSSFQRIFSFDCDSFNVICNSVILIILAFSFSSKSLMFHETTLFRAERSKSWSETRDRMSLKRIWTLQTHFRFLCVFWSWRRFWLRFFCVKRCFWRSSCSWFSYLTLAVSNML